MLAGRPCGRWVPLMGGTPATHRRSRCASLATLPRVAFRPPPLTPAPPAERLRSMASRSRHRSAVVAERGLSRRVTERHRATLPMGRVSSASAQPALTCPGSRCLGNWLAPCRQDMDSVARNHLAACGGGEPLRSRSRQKRPGRLLRPGPNAQSPRPFWFSSALRSSSQNALIAVAIPRSVKRTTIPLDRSTANPSLPPLTFLVAPSDFEW